MNVLTMALALIPRSTFEVLEWVENTTDDRGIMVDTYAEPVVNVGHVQAVNRSAYQALGLDFQKRYIKVFTDSTPVGDLYRDRSADIIVWNGQQYKATSTSDWMVLDGWQRITAVAI